MRNSLFSAMFVALATGGCYISQTPIVMSPRGEILSCSNFGRTELAPSSVLFTASTRDGASREVYVFAENHPLNKLIVPARDLANASYKGAWKIDVEPLCGFKFGYRPASLSFSSERWHIASGFLPGRYTALVIARAPVTNAVLSIDAQSFSVRGGFRPRRLRVDGGEILANEIVRLPRVSGRYQNIELNATLNIPE